MKQNLKLINVLLSVAAVLLGVYLLDQFGFMPVEMFDGNTSSGKTIVLFYLPGCGHCKNMMPEWNRFEQRAQKTGIIAKKINCDEHPEEAAKNNVTGFPTIILFKDGERHVFDQQRTADSIEHFVNSM